MKFPKALGASPAALVIRGVVTSLAPTADPTDNSTPEWSKKRKVPGLEVSFVGGKVRGVLAAPEQVQSLLGMGLEVTVFCSVREFQGQYRPDVFIVTQVGDKPTPLAA